MAGAAAAVFLAGFATFAAMPVAAATNTIGSFETGDHWQVPADVTSIVVDVSGAGGGDSYFHTDGATTSTIEVRAAAAIVVNGGLGGELTATLPVTPCSMLSFQTGFRGHDGADAASNLPRDGVGGAGGGGAGGTANGSGSGAGGGGGSAVFSGDTILAAAGGGGGAGGGIGAVDASGGAGSGGNVDAADGGVSAVAGSGRAGHGGTPGAGGAGGAAGADDASVGGAGTLDHGGQGGGAAGDAGGGGGGGGWFGGGGGGGGAATGGAIGGGGGGGAGYVEPAATGVVARSGISRYDGSIYVSYEGGASCGEPTSTTTVLNNEPSVATEAVSTTTGPGTGELPRTGNDGRTAFAGLLVLGAGLVLALGGDATSSRAERRDRCAQATARVEGVFADQVVECFAQGHRLREEEALPEVAAHRAHGRRASLRCRCLRRPPTRSCAAPRLTIALSIASSRELRPERLQERPVDLDRVDREQAQVGERAVAAAEVVERDVHAEVADTAHDRGVAVGVVEHHRLGDLEGEQLGREPAARRARPGRRCTRSPDSNWRTETFTDTPTPGAMRLPARAVDRRVAQHPRADLDDDAGLLGDRDEVVGRMRPTPRPVPTDERLEVGDAARAARSMIGW